MGAAITPACNMTEIANLLTPVFDMLQDEVVREKLEDSARVFFSNSNLTINLIPALIIGALGLLFLLPLLGIPILDVLGGGHGGGYSAPSTGYGYVARGDTTYYDQTIAHLQQQVAALQESEANLRNSLYYNNPVGDGAQATNNVGYGS